MEENSPYQASRVAPTAERRDHRDEPPREITGPIKHMWILLTVMGVVSVMGGVATLFLQGANTAILLLPLALIAAVYLVLAFGVYKRSRVVATLVLTFSVLGALGGLLNIVMGKGSLPGLAFTTVFLFVSVCGTLATYRYHRHLRDVRSRPPRSRLSDDPAFAPKLDTPL
ncbi:MAG: hypothetical protein ACREPC_05135 [Stenotrophomonas sp.]|uniref:hypothetical protein n=1 Tax=Stenotrophomonas sp. TaxID=69392 RepID=UPI003D6DA662